MYFIIMESFVYSRLGLSRKRCAKQPVRVETELFYISVYILFYGWIYRRTYQALRGKSEFSVTRIQEKEIIIINKGYFV